MKKLIKLDNFSVYINRNACSFVSYKNLCNIYGIAYDRSWSGNTTYYGTKDNNSSHCDDRPFGSTLFESVKDFEAYLKNSLGDYEIF